MNSFITINPELINPSPYPVPFPSLFDPIVLYGDDGNNVLEGRLGSDSLYGQGGNDSIYGAWGNDYLAGGSGEDVLHGDEGNDLLYGELGSDSLNGGSGNDSLDGYRGSESAPFASRVQFDSLTGGTEADTFILGRLSPLSSGYGFTHQPIVYYIGEGHATITDFNRTEGDKIQVANDFGLLQYSFEFYGSGTYIRQQGDLIADVKNVNITQSDLLVLRPGFNPAPQFPQPLPF